MSRLPYLQASGEFYFKQRQRCFVRDDFTCQFQQLDLPEVAGHCTHDEPQTTLRYLQCHHVKHRIHGGTHDLDNLLTICKTHHVMIHPHMRFELESARLELSLTDNGNKEFPLPDKEL